MKTLESRRLDSAVAAVLTGLGMRLSLHSEGEPRLVTLPAKRQEEEQEEQQAARAYSDNFYKKKNSSSSNSSSIITNTTISITNTPNSRSCSRCWRDMSPPLPMPAPPFGTTRHTRRT